MPTLAKNAIEFAIELRDAFDLICETNEAKGSYTKYHQVSTSNKRECRYYRGIFRRVVNIIKRRGSHPFADFIFARRGAGSIREAVEAFDWKAHGVSK